MRNVKVPLVAEKRRLLNSQGGGPHVGVVEGFGKGSEVVRFRRIVRRRGYSRI